VAENFPMKFTRREILTAFLGLPFALSACQSTSEISNKIEGEIIGQSVDFGHLIREHRNVEIPQDKWENVKVGIIGGGIAGLSVAWKFKKENFNGFVLL